MAYHQVITDTLHELLARLKREPGKTWLNDLLVRLDQMGLQALTNSFLSQQHNQEIAHGMFLELMIATAVIDAYPSGQITCERKDGYAKNPCDITLEYSGVCSDFQCKSVLNVYNELFAEQFLEWVDNSFSSVTPGALVELQPTVQASKETFEELQQWFSGNWQMLPRNEVIPFEDSAGSRIYLTLLDDIDPGIHQGVLLGATEDENFIQEANEQLVRQILEARLNRALKTFVFVPSCNQFNFVVIEVTNLAVTFEEDDIAEALYGTTSHLIGGPLVVPKQNLDGLFYKFRSQKKVEYCSGVVLCQLMPDRTFDCAVYPNPLYWESVTDEWTNRGPFRLFQIG